MVEATESAQADRVSPIKTAILAGSGRLPELTAIALRDSGNEPLVVSINGEAGPWIKHFDHQEVKSVAVGVLVRRMRAKGVRQVALCGGVGVRPSLWSIRPDWVTLTNLRRFYNSLGKGDDALLRSVICLLEEQGFKVIGAHEILPDLLAPAGVLTKRKPTGGDERDCAMALEAAIGVGRDDLGQAAIAIGGAVVAVEDARGTDALLARVKEMRGGGVYKTGGVLAKAAKPQQEHRADLPSIGPDTVDKAAQAGLAGIIVSAGSSLMLDRDEIIRRAEAAGMFIEGRSVGNLT